MPSSEGRNDASIWFPLTFFKLIAVGFPGESNSAVMSADPTRLSNTLSLNVTCKKVIVDRWNIKGTIHLDNNGRYPQFESNPRFMHFYICIKCVCLIKSSKIKLVWNFESMPPLNHKSALTFFLNFKRRYKRNNFSSWKTESIGFLAVKT